MKGIKRLHLPYVIAAIVLFLAFLLIENGYNPYVINLILLNIVAACSLRTIYLSGQISLGQAAFMAVGGYASALLAMRLGWSPWVCAPLGGLIAAISALLAGYVLTRITSFYFSMGTLFLGLGVEYIIEATPQLTGGYIGLTGIPQLGPISIPGIFHIDFAGSPISQFCVILFVTILSLLILYRIEHSRIGLTWRAIGQSAEVALSVGINVAYYRVVAFTIGGFFTGLTGAVLAHYNAVLSPSGFGMMGSIDLLAYVLVGGAGSFVGPVFGTIILLAIPQVFSSLQEFVPFLVAGAMLLVVFVLPRGVAGLFANFPSCLTGKTQNSQALYYKASGEEGRDVSL